MASDQRGPEIIAKYSKAKPSAAKRSQAKPSFIQT